MKVLVVGDPYMPVSAYTEALAALDDLVDLSTMQIDRADGTPPVTASELVLGKSLASVIPSVAITWLAFAIFVLAVDAVAWPVVHGALLPNGMWLFGVGVVAPLFAFLGNALAVLVSARVGEARLAQQLSALVVLPIMGLVSGQLAGWIRAGTGYYAVQGAVVLVLDVLLVRASVRLFDRERLMSRWT